MRRAILAIFLVLILAAGGVAFFLKSAGGSKFEEGLCYLNGSGVERDYARAFELFSEGAKAGDKDA